MRFGFAGVKHPHARGWATAVKDNGGTVEASYDPDPPKASAHAELAGGVQVNALSDLASHNLDAVIVDGRCDEVTDLALQVFDLGLPILLEKPGGMTAADLEQIATAAAEKNLPTQMGYFLRYAHSVAEAKQAIDDGSLGQISLVRCHAAMPHRAWDVMGLWFSDPTNITSIFQEDACHVVDITLHLLGVPDSLTASRITGNFQPTVGEDAIAAIFNYGTHLATIDFNAHEANPWIDTWSFEIYGTVGSLRIGLAPEWIERYHAQTGWVQSGEQRLTGPSDGHARDASSASQYQKGLAGLIQAIEGHGPPSVDAAAGLRVFQVVESIQKAADTGTTIAFLKAS